MPDPELVVEEAAPPVPAPGPLPKPDYSRAVRRSFTAMRRARSDAPFLLELGERDDETFVTFPGRIPGAVLLDASNLVLETTGSVDYWAVFEAGMEPDEYERFRAYLRSQPDIDVDLLGSLIQSIQEAATGRPTQGSGGSGPGH